MRFLAERMKIVVEPTGCLALAGLYKMVRQGKIKTGARVGVILTGGNIDMQDYATLIK